jgi:type 1 fimbria pilin
MRFSSLILLLGILAPAAVFAQTSGSLQRITVTSVTIIMDSVENAADVELVRQEITKHPEVKDFDIKNKNCNFTIDNTSNTLDIIFSDLAQRGQPARVYAIEANQTFTRVPEENCMTKNRQADVKEEDYLKQHPELKNER